MLILSGPLPPPMNGQSVTFQFLVDECSRRGLVYHVVPYPGEGKRIAFSLRRAILFGCYFLNYIRALVRAPSGSAVYLVLGQSTRGFLRDALVILMGSMRGFRLTGHLHTGNYDAFVADCSIPKRLIGWVLRHLGALVLLSSRLRYMFSFDSRLDCKLAVVPNTAPIADRSVFVDTDEPRVVDHPLRLLYLGNLIESKGYLMLLDAVKLLHDRGQTVHVTYAGQFIASPDDRMVRTAAHARTMFFDRIASYGLKECVQFSGVVMGTAKTALLAAADVLVLPSTYFMEAQPVSILEAMSHGVAVVATEHRAIPDLVEHGVTGLLIKNATAQEVAAAIARLDRDRSLLSRMRIESRTRFLRQFSPSVHARRLLDVIQG